MGLTPADLQFVTLAPSAERKKERKKEKERERESVLRKRECVCVRERERESASARERERGKKSKKHGHDHNLLGRVAEGLKVNKLRHTKLPWVTKVSAWSLEVHVLQ